MLQSKLYFFSILLVLLYACSQKDDPWNLADPFIGTGGHGHTYPGAVAPFGMIQLSPDTRLTGWDGCSGYHYSDSIIYGFSQTHLSGTGVSDYGDFLISPQLNNAHLIRGTDEKEGYRNSFNHDEESASPGLYEVTFDNGIETKISAKERSGFYQFDFNDQGYLTLDLNHRDSLLDYWIEIRDPKNILAYRRSMAWAVDQRLFFHLRLKEPIQAIKEDKEWIEAPIYPFRTGSKVIGVKLSKSDLQQAYAAISAVDSTGARKNLESEFLGWDFEMFASNSKALWENQLNKIRVKGGQKEDRIKFYTALYHTMIAPNLYSDVDGRYRGRDLEIYHAGHDYYTVFSLWDTYRTLHPLHTIIEPERTRDFVKTLLLQYQQGGSLPVWELSACETMCMIGYHAVPVLADALMKGYKDFNAEFALEAAIHSSNLNHLGLEAYREYGFIPSELEPESVSKTLEYAYDDWCIAQMANFLGKDSIALIYLQRSQNWKNLFDPRSRFFRAKVNNGFVEPFDPKEVNFHFTEANAWHYSMAVQQAPLDLMKFLGGPEKLESRLDELFNANSETTGRHQADITGLIGQYAQGNEPSQHMAYLYNYCGAPFKTQKMTRRILDEVYSIGPEGLPGNEDCGQMSAWYVMSAIGLYPVTPGLPEYQITAPLFDEIEIQVSNEKTFRIITESNTKENVYIQEASLNGQAWSATNLKHISLIEGGELKIRLGNQASEWGSMAYSNMTFKKGITPVPYLGRAVRSFSLGNKITIETLWREDTIHFSIDGNQPQEYSGPIILERDTEIEFWAKNSGIESKRVKSRFVKKPDWSILTLTHPYAPQYSAGGDQALVDGIKGLGSFASGDWQGYQGENLEAIIDLGSLQKVYSVETAFYHDPRSWIYFPKQVQYYVSEDGKSYSLFGVDFNEVDLKTKGPLTQRFMVRGAKKARYMKVVGINRGTNPPWHISPGGSSWIFADEIQIRAEKLVTKARE